MHHRAFLCLALLGCESETTCTLSQEIVFCSRFDPGEADVSDDELTTALEVTLDPSAFDGRELALHAETDRLVHDHPNSDPPLEGAPGPMGMTPLPDHDPAILDVLVESDVYVPYDSYERVLVEGTIRVDESGHGSIDADVGGVVLRASFERAD